MSGIYKNRFRLPEQLFHAYHYLNSLETNNCFVKSITPTII